MASWILLAAAVSIAVTAALTWALYRMNAPARPRGSGGSGDRGSSALSGGSDQSWSDSGSDGGGD